MEYKGYMEMDIILGISALVISGISIGMQVVNLNENNKQHRENLTLEYWTCLLNYELTELETFQNLHRETSDEYALMNMHSSTSNEFRENKHLWFSFKKFKEEKSLNTDEAWPKFKERWKAMIDGYETTIKRLEEKCSTYKSKIENIIES